MRKTNDKRYDDLIEQALLLMRTNEYGTSRERMKKLREVVFLMEAYERGEDIVQAKLRMTNDDLRNQQTAPILRKHLSSLYREEDLSRLKVGYVDQLHAEGVISDAVRMVLLYDVISYSWARKADDYLGGNLA